MGRGRPKGSKNKPKERLENAQERSAHRDVAGENEETKSDNDNVSVLPPQTGKNNCNIDEATIENNVGGNGVGDAAMVAGNEININGGNGDADLVAGNQINNYQLQPDNDIENDQGLFQFDPMDEYGELFCKLSLIPNEEIFMTDKRWKLCKRAITNLAKEYMREQSEKKLFNILSFWKLLKQRGRKERLEDNIENLGQGKAREMLIKRLQFVRTTKFKMQPQIDEDFLSEKEIARAIKLLEKGDISKAATVINNQTKGVAAMSTSTVDSMKLLNPQGSNNPFGNSAGPKAPVVMDIGILQKIVSELNKHAAAGIDGWTVKQVQKCFGTMNDGDHDTTIFRGFFLHLFQSMILGTVPGKTMLSAARLTPLLKITGGLRPVCCGTLFYRIGMRYAMKCLNDPDDLLNTQFGSGGKGGVEPILELIQQRVDGCSEEKQWYLYMLDLRNAFNLVDRQHLAKSIQYNAPHYYQLAKMAYNKPSPLILTSADAYVVIPSSTGVRQGGPEASKFFNIAMRPIMGKIQNDVLAASDDLISYEDNIYVISLNPNLMQPLKQHFALQKLSTGCELRDDKCARVSLMSVKQGAAVVDTLGGCIGTKHQRQIFIEQKIQDLQKALTRLEQLPKQHSLLILRSSIAMNLKHLLRCMDCMDLTEEIRTIDNMIYTFVDRMRGVQLDTVRTDIQEDILALPMKMGGAGLSSYQTVLPCARTASLQSSRTELLQRKLVSHQHMADLQLQLSHEGVLDSNNKYNAVGPMPTAAEEETTVLSQKQLTAIAMEKRQQTLLTKLTEEQKLAFVDNTGGHKWMTAIPNNRWRRLLDKQVAAALNILLLVPQETAPLCTRCSNHNSINHFELCSNCTQIPQQQSARHNHIRDKIQKYAEKDKDLIVTNEPMLPTQPNIPNNRADFYISTQAGKAQHHLFFGYFDIMTKVLLSAHTDLARNTAKQQIVTANITDPIKQQRKILQAALEVGVKQKANTYALHTAAGTNVTALLISTGGTLHSNFYKFIKKTFPDDTVRCNVLTDIAIGLIRARTNLYSHVFMIDDAIVETQT